MAKTEKLTPEQKAEIKAQKEAEKEAAKAAKEAEKARLQAEKDAEPKAVEAPVSPAIVTLDMVKEKATELQDILNIFIAQKTKEQKSTDRFVYARQQLIRLQNNNFIA